VYCQAEVSATGPSLVQRSLTECGVSECDVETSTMRRPMPTRAVEPWKKIYADNRPSRVYFYNPVANVLRTLRQVTKSALNEHTGFN
jgi:hypothetical protein